ncbi:MAG: Hpt domain-containing protein [Magnetovibrio sp.]|nr:Hpt domain-containing protein [Magnetovibrio sp.]
MNKAHPVEIINVPNTLQNKVSRAHTEEQKFTAANEVIASYSKQFALRLPGELSNIEDLHASLSASPTDEDLQKKLFTAVHDLKGQAGTFDYMMITVVGNDLCRFIEHAQSITPPHLKVMLYHIEAMKIIAQKRMTGDEPEGAQRMIDTLHSMTQKVLQA